MKEAYDNQPIRVDAKTAPKKPDVRLDTRSSYIGFLHGSVHNETGKPLQSLKLSIQTARWEKIYEVKLWVDNNTTRAFSVQVGDKDIGVLRSELVSFEVCGR